MPDDRTTPSWRLTDAQRKALARMAVQPVTHINRRTLAALRQRGLVEPMHVPNPYLPAWSLRAWRLTDRGRDTVATLDA